jgi:hypothetical protein
VDDVIVSHLHYVVLPGHDPLVMERLRKVADGIVEL